MRSIALGLSALLLSAPVLAEEQEGTPPQIAALFPPGEDYCYVGKSEAGARKPKQTLTEFYLYRTHDPNPQLEEIAPERAEAIRYFKRPDSGKWTDVLARFTDKPFLYSQSLSCYVWAEGGGQVFCGVDCDGGSFKVNATASGLDAVFEPESHGLSLNQSCGDPDEEGKERWMTAADAGGTVALVKSPPSICADLDREAKPAFAADPVPLRERIATSGWRCLKRSYDKAHMAKHPQQQVTAVALSIKGPAFVDKTEGGYPSTLLDVSLSFRLRDGAEEQRDVQCRASQYQFYCDGGFRLRRRDGASALLAAGEYVDKDNPPVMLDVTLGTDDALFRLEASGDATCQLP